MSRTIIDHPCDPNLTAAIGWDHAVSFFVDVIMVSTDNSEVTDDEHHLASYSAIEPHYDHETPLKGALHFLASQGFFTSDDLFYALWCLHTGDDPDDDTISKVMAIIHVFKQAADQ